MKCTVCKQPIRVSIFRGTGFCSDICRKVKAKEISKKDADKLRSAQRIFADGKLPEEAVLAAGAI